MNLYPRVGIGVLLIKDNKILLGKRKNSHGSGDWSPAGGHLKFGETPEQCAIREVFEETGIIIKSIEKATFVNDIFIQENKHYVTIFMISYHFEGNQNY